MNFVIEPVTNRTMEAEAAYVREEVFGREWHMTAPRLSGCEPGCMLTLIARTRWGGDPAAALTVIDTTGDTALHNRLGLQFRPGERVARYTQLAVLKPYRQMGLPVLLVGEARRLFIEPGRFGHSWLLFDADRAKTASLCTVLGFRASSLTFQTEYGRSRVLLMNENGAAAVQSNRIPLLAPGEWAAQ